MIVLRTPKGWTGPDEVDGLPVEGTWRAHQVPLAGVRDDPEHLRAAGGRGCAPTGPRSCSTTTAARGRELRARCPAGRPAAWAPTRTPTAALLLRDLRAARLPATTPSRSSRPGRHVARADPGARRACCAT